MFRFTCFGVLPCVWNSHTSIGIFVPHLIVITPPNHSHSGQHSSIRNITTKMLPFPITLRTLKTKLREVEVGALLYDVQRNYALGWTWWKLPLRPRSLPTPSKDTSCCVSYEQHRDKNRENALEGYNGSVLFYETLSFIL